MDVDIENAMVAVVIIVNISQRFCKSLAYAESNEKIVCKR